MLAYFLVLSRFILEADNLAKCIWVNDSQCIASEIMVRPIPNKAIELVKEFEVLRTRAYWDRGGRGSGVLTIGYGHTGPDVKEGQIITEKEADDLLAQDLQHAAAAVNRLTRYPLNDNQYAALISFVFNVGSGAYQRSTLRQHINRGELAYVPKELLRWTLDNGVYYRGLKRRREAESKLFLC